MVKHSQISKSYDSTPRPLYVYLFIAVVVIVVITAAYANRDAITGFVTNVANNISGKAEMSAVINTSATIIVIPEPSCVSTCGDVCWLVQSGQREGNITSSSGKLGNIGCDGNCWATADMLERCCHNSDCSKDKLCESGICA